MTRRDRAAMVLALECCRGSGPMSAAHALLHGDGEAQALRRAALGAPKSTRAEMRVFRARLALALRVLLRADRGDYGPREYWWQHFRDDRGPCAIEAGWVATIGGWEKPLPVRPLWEAAPQHDPAVTPAMRRTLCAVVALLRWGLS